MKYLINILVFVLILSSSVGAQQGWVRQQFGGTYDVFRSVYFFDANTGWITGHGGAILKTTDGGSNWDRQSPIPMNLHSIYFVDADTGWAVGDVGAVLRSIDGGDNWSVKFDVGGSTLFNHHLSVYFTNTKVGWAAGSLSEDGKILKTTDGGKTWSSQNINVKNWLNSIYFIDANTGWTVGNAGKIFKTIDGGSNWELQYTDTTKFLRSVHFIDENIGWVVGQYGLILKTTDGGINWMVQNCETSELLRSVRFVDENSGWAVGTKGVILHTTNSGENWNLQASGTNKTLYSVFFVDDRTGWIVGSEGVILKTTSGGVTSVEDNSNKNSAIPDRLTLSQNYPNPFNPSTTIRFGLSQQGFVTLRIFDLMGREIETLVSGMRSAGEHEVNWIATDLPSGIYLVRLEAGKSVQTKKLVFQK